MAKSGRTYDIVSGDSHVVEPPDLWQKWLPKKYLDRAPKLVKDEDGGDAWLYEEAGLPEPLGLVTDVNTPPEKLRWTGVRYGKEIHPSCHDGKERLKILDIDRVDAETLYPPQRAIGTFMRNKDHEVQLAGIRAYNRWLKEDFCAADPSRLIGLAQIPNAGVEAAVTELRWAHDQGYQGAILAAWPSGGEILGREDDPFWAAAEELGMPVSIHILLHNNAPPRRRAIKEAGAVLGCTAFGNFMPYLVELVMSGVFDRYPKLKMVGAEVGAGWVPHFLEMMDDRYWRNRIWGKVALRKVPSHYFRSNWLVTFIVDRIGIEVRHAVGVENMAWSTDFPHHGNDYPYSRKVIDEHFVNVPDDERRKIVCDNVVGWYGLA
jgi:predicted TIM-barrel fold metal-dependent hydrolase